MENLINESGVLIVEVLKNLSAIGILVGFFSWLHRRFTAHQRKQLEDIQMHIKRLELLQAIDHDYGLQVVGGIFDEYEKLGGNHYAHDLFEDYKRKK